MKNMITRNGKIARLPQNIREQLNRRLDDDEPGGGKHLSIVLVAELGESAFDALAAITDLSGQAETLSRGVKPVPTGPDQAKSN